MRVLFDTSVLVPALVRNHPHHEPAAPWLGRAQKREVELAMSNHNLAELYSGLTSLPPAFRVPPRVAWELIHKMVLPLATIVSLVRADYLAVLDRLATAGLPGGIVYDALIIQAAIKCKADRLLTFNVSHFRRIWPEGAARIIAP